MTGQLAPGLTERVFQVRVVELARWLRLRVFHSGDSRRDLCAGFPDLVIVGPRDVLYVELKTETGRIRPEQIAWLRALEEAGQRAYVWRPAQWSEINRVLHDLAGRPCPREYRGRASPYIEVKD